MTIIRQWSGDDLSAADLAVGSIGTNDTAFSSIYGGGTFTITNDGLYSPQITWPTTSGAHQVRWNTLGSLNAWAIRRYFSIATLPGVTWGLFSGHDSTGNDLFRVEVNSSGLLRYRSGSAAVYSPTVNALAENTIYRIELVGQADGTSTIALYEGNLTTALLQSSVSVTAGTLDEVRFGHHSNMATTGETGDSFAVADEAVFIGPVEDGGSTEVVITQKWQGDGLTAGTLTTSSAGTDDTPFSTVTGSLTIEDAGRRSPRILLPDTASVKRVHWWPLATDPLDTYALRWYQTFGAYPSSEISLAQGLIGGGADKWSIRMTSTGFLRVRDDAASIVLWTSTTALLLNQPIRFELIVDGVDATSSMYKGDVANSLDSATLTLSDVAIDELRLGVNSAIATNAITYDDIAFHSKAVSHGAAGLPAQVHTHFRYNGTEWVPQDVSFL